MNSLPTEGRQALWIEWQRLMNGFGVAVAASEPIFAGLWVRYNETHRAYHNGTHLANVLAGVGDLAPDADDPALVTLAAWFHDAVYNPRRGDNEEQSALLARSQLQTLDLQPSTLAETTRLVLLTQHHQTTEGDRNGAVLIDADLAILGAAPERYAAYARAIRQEYWWVEGETYRRERMVVLRRLLARETLYITQRMGRQREVQARANLAWEIEKLQHAYLDGL